MSDQQGQFDFDSPGTQEGYTQWLVDRQVAQRELALRMGLPLGRQVEVWLMDGTRLRGKLHLQTEFLLIEEERARHLPLRIGEVRFTYREIESCVRLD